MVYGTRGAKFLNGKKNLVADTEIIRARLFRDEVSNKTNEGECARVGLSMKTHTAQLVAAKI